MSFFVMMEPVYKDTKIFKFCGPLGHTDINSYLCTVRFLKANSVFDGKQFLPDHAVLVLDNSNRLEAIITDKEVDTGNTERLEGLLTPGFVNSHCHLELSHLKHHISQATGLPEFGRQVILNRSRFSREETTERMQQADLEMWHNGIVAVGDISNDDSSFVQKTNSKVFYHTFLELIGLNPANADNIFKKGLELMQTLEAAGLQGSLAPHAPYSTSLLLIAKIAEKNKLDGTPFSIHNQESEEETKFFVGKKNDFAGLYKFLGLDLSWFEAPGINSLQYYAGALTDTPALLVHNTCTNKEDLEAVSSKQVFWCFCPSANQYIEMRLPDFELFRNLEGTICLGTDSLASNDTLDLVKEANIILKATNAFSLEAVLKALTSNGAAALSISNNFGQLRPGKNTGLNLLAHKNEQLQFIKKIS